VVRALGIWGQGWLELDREHIDPDFLIWRNFKHLPQDKLPADRRVVRFDFTAEGKSYWLVLKRDDPDLCYTDPRFGEDMIVRADLETLTPVYLGELELNAAWAVGLVELNGPRSLVRSMAAWFPVSGYAPYARPVRYDATKRTFIRVEKPVRPAATA